MQERLTALIAALVSAALLTSCGGTVVSNSGLTIVVNPSAVSVVTSGSQQFSAEVPNANPLSQVFVTWSVNGTPGGNSTVGTISTFGVYTAPANIPSPNMVTVTATSAADPSKTATATVTIKPAPIVFSVSVTVFSGGPLASATVKVSNVNPADGSVGALLGTAITDSSGNCTVTLSSSPTGPIIITASGGTYTSTADGTVTTGTITLSAFVDAVTGPKTTGIAVTPLTDFVATLTKAKLTGPGTPPTFANAHGLGNALIAQFYGLGLGATTETIIPSFSKSDITANPRNFNAGFVISSLESQGKTLIPATPDKLVAALSLDLDDGVLDGKGSAPIPLGNGNLNSTAGTVDFLFAGNGCAGSCSAIKNGGSAAADLKGVTATVSSGVQASTLTPKAFGLTPGSSASLATFAFGGHQYVFIAARTKGVVVLDVTDPSNIPPPKAWTSLANSTFNQNFVGGIIPVVGYADHPQVLTYAFALPTIALVNAQVLATGAPGVDDAKLVDFKTDLSITHTPIFINNDSTYFAGGIADNGRRGVWLATGDGYEFFDLNTLTVTKIFPIDAGQELPENMGGNITHNVLLGGNWTGMQLVDLTKQKSYDMDPAFFTSNIIALEVASCQNYPMEPCEPVDANSVDTGFRVEVGTGKHVSTSFFINLAQLTTNDTNSTFVPSAGAFAALDLTSSTPIDLSGPAVESTSHLVLFSGDNTADVAVGVLQDPGSVPTGGQWTGLSDWVFFNGASHFFVSGDPHEFGSIYNVGAGKAFGYLLASDDSHVIQVDMQGFLNLPRQGATGDAAHQPVSDPWTVGILTPIIIP
ncbi:MAG TPA: hypothetical protein VKV95_04095 [Terriglobia bacterium]|nr:hypothetical protein [Terriglobia bacterium]